MERSTTIGNTKALADDLLMLIPVLDKETIDVEDSALDIDLAKQRIQMFLDNNLLMRYLIESDQLSDNDRSNRASALRLMKENLEYQDDLLAHKAKDSGVEAIRVWAHELADKRDQLSTELSLKNSKLGEQKETIESYLRCLKEKMLKSCVVESMQQSLTETKTTAAQLQIDVEHLEEQLGEIRHNLQQLHQIAKNTTDEDWVSVVSTTAEDGDCDSVYSTADTETQEIRDEIDFFDDIDKCLQEKINDASDNGGVLVISEEKYQYIDLWRRMLQWKRRFSQKEVKVLGWLSHQVIHEAVRDSFNKFIEVHVKPNKGIPFTYVIDVFLNGNIEEVKYFVKETRKFEWWKQSLYFLRGYARMLQWINLSALNSYK